MAAIFRKEKQPKKNGGKENEDIFLHLLAPPTSDPT